MKAEPNSFGAFARAARLSAKLGLREVSREISISAAYLSRVENDLEAPSGELIVNMSRMYHVPLEKLTSRITSSKASAAAHGQTMQASPELRALYRLGTQLDSDAIEDFIRKLLRDQQMSDKEIEKKLASLKSELPRISGNTRDGLFAADAKPRFLTRKQIARMAQDILKRSGLCESDFSAPIPIELLVENEPGVAYRIDRLRCDKHGNPLVLGLTGWDDRGNRQIVINSVLADGKRHSDGARFNFTLAHELFHAIEHLPRAPKEDIPPMARMGVFSDGIATSSAAVRAVRSWSQRTGGSRRLVSDEDWREWQANTFASELLMPDWAVRAELLVRTGVTKFLITKGSNLRQFALDLGGQTEFSCGFFEKSLADLFAVSGQAMAIRILQLEIMEEADV